MPVCPMCDTEVPEFHKRSHVLPDWAYDDAKDELNRTISISFKHDSAKLRQSGIYGSFWCASCETESNWPDTYASRVLTLKGRASREAQRLRIKPIALKVNGEDLAYVEWKGLDYKSLSRFVQVTVLRAHLHGLTEEDKESLLTDAEFKALRFTYRSELLDDKSFPIIGSVEPDGSVYHSMVMPPHQGNLGSGRCVEFKGPGFVFFLQLDKLEPGSPFELMRLKQSGEFVTLVRRYEEGGSFRSNLPRFAEILGKYPADRFKPKRR